MDLPEHCLEFSVHMIGDKRRHRMRFDSNQAAKDHRKATACGGWILGTYLYPGEWTPSQIMINCPDRGILE